MAKEVTRDGDLFATHPESLDFTPGHRIHPLIGGKATYAELERCIEGAESSVHMAYWTLDPGIRVTSQVGAERLSDLLRRVIDRGVALRIVIADFDPVIGATFHRDAWRAYRKLLALADGLAGGKAKNLSVMCSRHDTHWGPLGRTVAQPILRKTLAGIVDTVNALESRAEREDYLANAPGLWPFLHYDGTQARVKADAFPGVYPAAHHEKLCVIDDKTVFVGGLDITAKRKDGWDHDNSYPWHDVACRLEGPAAAFFAQHFRSRWNEERAASMAFLESAVPPEGIAALPDSGELPDLPTQVPDPEPVADGVSGRPLRTISKQARAPFSRSPASQITEFREAYLDVIAGAQDFLYIENQFIRSAAIAEALARRAAENGALELMLVLPLLPEDAFVAGQPDMATRHGQYLREKNTDLLREAFGDRIGIFSMQMPRGGVLSDPENDDPDAIVENSIYVHAKTLICDDHTAIIGSANLNDRSLVTDTETGIAWRDPVSVKDYRVRLWRHALDLDTSDWTGSHLARWRTAARNNARGEHRQGFIVPLPDRYIDAHAKRSWLVPDELV